MVDLVFLGFDLGFLYLLGSTTGLESFSLRSEKFSISSSFGGGSVRFFFSV